MLTTATSHRICHAILSPAQTPAPYALNPAPAIFMQAGYCCSCYSSPESSHKGPLNIPLLQQQIVLRLWPCQHPCNRFNESFRLGSPNVAPERLRLSIMPLRTLPQKPCTTQHCQGVPVRIDSLQSPMRPVKKDHARSFKIPSTSNMNAMKL